MKLNSFLSSRCTELFLFLEENKGKWVQYNYHIMSLVAQSKSLTSNIISQVQFIILLDEFLEKELYLLFSPSNFFPNPILPPLVGFFSFDDFSLHNKVCNLIVVMMLKENFQITYVKGKAAAGQYCFYN